ncbi:MAG: hypothetical protein JNK84_00815 [Phreatobacter sp.]|uniref:hypothetical protein n=1 Tax=Phreatobacter sp. TaxID=1966341 RepID=UPI001A43CC0C|nr:hypothetical protein [Phreatobacter sp.]MBL8567602.1 hypothetical protein [Phreatobacter sp.]
MQRIWMATPWQAFLRGIPALTGLAAAGLAAAHLDLVLIWMVPACLIGLALGASVAGGTGTASLASALLFAGFGMTIGLVPTASLTASQVVGPVIASVIPAHPSALGYRLAGARIMTEFAAARAFRGTRNYGAPVTWHAAPLVDPGWAHGDPVPVWIIAQENAGSDPASPAAPRHWGTPPETVLRVGAPSSGRGPDVAALAAERHGLRSASGAIYVTGSADPERDRRTDMRLVLALLGLAIAAHGAIVSRFWKRLRRRKAG